ncbi:MAG: tRNA (5-methylaminomethyl-2-thiouridine)(34)-methyltransferase MnmD, partial [Pseudomonadota bacterium]
VDCAPAAVDVLAARGGPAAPAPGSAPPGAAPGDFRLEIIKGDARETLPRWGGTVDAWFLDGFSPAKNPAMWDADLLRAVAAHTRPGGTCATYTAAGAVRRALAAAGFEVTRATGFGRKRHMTRGRLPGDTAP